MKSTLHSHLLAAALALAAVPALQATLIPVQSYSYGTAPSGSYPDSGGVELTDGITNSIVWNGSNSPSFAQVSPLAGWQFSAPNILFTFAGPVTIGSFTVWAADSNGAAGVYVPSSLTLSAPSAAFSQTFATVDPAGSGTVVPLTFSGFTVTTNQIRLTAVNPFNWTMFSEVQFFAAPAPVPEPASASALAGAFAAGCVLFRRRRRS
jgi:hypothetical protein